MRSYITTRIGKRLAERRCLLHFEQSLGNGIGDYIFWMMTRPRDQDVLFSAQTTSSLQGWRTVVGDGNLPISWLSGKQDVSSYRQEKQ
jgi:hypothetical protein